MIRPTISSVVPLLMLAKLAAGIGCNTHSFTTCDDGIVHWYDPEDGQICDPLDCGGGRAPPKKNPGCDGYTGTEVRTVSYLSCWKDFATVAEGFTSAAEPTTEAEVETETDTQPAETEPSESSPSTTTAVDSSTATSAAATTSPATLSTRTQTSASSAESEESTAGNAASTAENEATTPTTAPNAGQVLRGSVITVFGFAIGAIVFL
ncbi:uncharacterized protein NECHADRAFT_90711 [Fusarium vanettenii 77-13-4]|uniref:Uncharacterized protein n=1 Tax=Fusarium vanettenii (strain ATCC MYA-4622 / CBS 123669 / FGSC 9596 / NRRL 45880 / 77-13-4) TaxID=660122 RepID=C7Z695_FUSV7|nr:uncharacterized protein NECHADRAFT_90711 [Fusarium vanettenii 77-13-4]EEU40087.1 hypothetical protein NECHADRAFT_90711 [Fusarium vanettenii 77-13-4]